MGKSWLRSKTLWVNASAAVTALGAVAQGLMDWQTALVPVGMAIMNMILRIVTKQPLE